MTASRFTCLHGSAQVEDYNHISDESDLGQKLAVTITWC